MKLLKLGMRSATTAGAVMAVVMATSPAGWAANKYGDAVVEQGSMTIIREGEAKSFKASNQPVIVNEKDLVRVRDSSRVVLKTSDRATVTLGANAVFQVEPWEREEKKGFFKMLFGRFRASVAGLAGGERFNVKTATATIGVKGTEYTTAVTPAGYTSVLGIESVVENTGNDGVGQPVGPGQVSVTASPATPAVPAPQDVIDAMRNLNSPSPWSSEALALPAIDALVKAGVVSQATADKMKADLPPPEQSQTGPNTNAPPPQDYGNAQQQGQVFKGKLHPSFQR